MDQCLNEQTIDRYVRHLCSKDEAVLVRAHVADCEPCKRRVELAFCESPEKEGDPSRNAEVGVSPATESPAGPPRDGSVTVSMPEASEGQGGSRAGQHGPEVAFEGYEILEELGRGGQAIVYKAIQKATGKKVALKVLLPGREIFDEDRRRFKQEVDLIVKLDHPNIVAIVDSGIIRGQYYFAMSYVHGKPLHRYVQSKALSLRDKLVLFGKICDAMAHAHQNCVIHRDLKPSNILVDDRGEPHVLDFGLAKTATSLGHASETGHFMGTIPYASPEQAAGRAGLDVRTDVYSLGVVLYEMSTGKLPYDVSGSDFEARKNIQYAEPARPRLTTGRFDSDVEAIILKCLAKDPDQRYPSAGELKEEGQRWLKGEPIVAKSVSSVYLLRKIVSNHKYTATVVGLLLVIMAGFAAFSLELYRLLGTTRTDLEMARTLYDKQSDQVLLMARSTAFLQFLEAWRQADLAKAQRLAAFMVDNESKEKKSAVFLLQSELAQESDGRYRDSLADEEKWFADFVLAEKHSRQGDGERARQLCKSSYQAMSRSHSRGGSLPDKLFEGYIRTRLLEMTLAGHELEIMATGR